MNDNNQANVVTFSTKHLCIYAKIGVVTTIGSPGGTPGNLTVWIGPFRSEQLRSEWRSNFETVLEGQERIELKDIRSTVMGRKTSKLTSFDIDPNTTSPESALQMLPQIALDKLSVHA